MGHSGALAHFSVWAKESSVIACAASSSLRVGLDSRNTKEFPARIASFILAIGLLFAMQASSAKPVIQPFTGSWIACDRYQGYDVCSYKVLAQNGAHICGLWGYWASGREYQGRLAGKVTEQTAKVDRICGRPGSDTSTECARDDSTPQAWEPSDRTLLICKGALYEGRPGQPTSCKGINKDLGMHRARGNVQSKAMFVPEDKAWLKACATGTAG